MKRKLVVVLIMSLALQLWGCGNFHWNNGTGLSGAGETGAGPQIQGSVSGSQAQEPGIQENPQENLQENSQEKSQEISVHPAGVDNLYNIQIPQFEGGTVLGVDTFQGSIVVLFQDESGTIGLYLVSLTNMDIIASIELPSRPEGPGVHPFFQGTMVADVLGAELYCFEDKILVYDIGASMIYEFDRQMLLKGAYELGYLPTNPVFDSKGEVIYYRDGNTSLITAMNLKDGTTKAISIYTNLYRATALFGDRYLACDGWDQESTGMTYVLDVENGSIYDKVEDIRIDNLDQYGGFYMFYSDAHDSGGDVGDIDQESDGTEGDGTDGSGENGDGSDEEESNNSENGDSNDGDGGSTGGRAGNNAGGGSAVQGGVGSSSVGHEDAGSGSGNQESMGESGESSESVGESNGSREGTGESGGSREATGESGEGREGTGESGGSREATGEGDEGRENTGGNDGNREGVGGSVSGNSQESDSAYNRIKDKDHLGHNNADRNLFFGDIEGRVINILPIYHGEGLLSAYSVKDNVIDNLYFNPEEEENIYVTHYAMGTGVMEHELAFRYEADGGGDVGCRDIVYLSGKNMVLLALSSGARTDWYLWDLSKEVINVKEGEEDLFSCYLEPDKGMEQLKTKAKAIGEQYHVAICVGDELQDCPVKEYQNAQCDDVAATGAALNAAGRALASSQSEMGDFLGAQGYPDVYFYLCEGIDEDPNISASSNVFINLNPGGDGNTYENESEAADENEDGNQSGEADGHGDSDAAVREAPFGYYDVEEDRLCILLDVEGENLESRVYHDISYVVKNYLRYVDVTLPVG